MATPTTMRTPLISNAVSFLRDVKTQQSPLDKRIEFLRAKGLTNEEIDEAFRQIGWSSTGGPTPSAQNASFTQVDPSSSSSGEFFSVPVQSQQYQLPGNQSYQTVPYPYGMNPGYGQQQPPLLEAQRDWRDWFIMAVVSGSVMMGVYSIARKYLFPHLVPPPLPAFQQSQQDLEAQFDAIQKQLDEMSAQTETQTKMVETQRDEVIKVVGDVEKALHDMEAEGEKAKQELKEIREEVTNIRELVPKLIESSQAAATSTLTDVQQELKSLKLLLLARPQTFTGPSGSATPTQLPYSSTSSLPYNFGGGPGAQSPSGSPGYLLSGRPSIPSWQLAAKPAAPASASASSAVPPTTEKTKESEDLGASGVLVQGEPEVMTVQGQGASAAPSQI